MILLTGAGGKTGLAVLKQVVSRSQDVRAFIRRTEQVETVRAMGAVDVMVGDLQNWDDLQRAVDGVELIYHICPNMHPDEVRIGQQLTGAAVAGGVSRLVYHSVLHPQTEEMPHHWHKLRVEEQLFKSGLAYTILQPAAYMQNILAGWQSIVDDGRYLVPYATSTRLGMVDLDDVAEVAAMVLTKPGHEGAIYELAGPESLSQDEIAAELTKHVGRPVEAVFQDRDVWARRARQSGVSAYAIDTLLKMFVYYENFGFHGNGHVLRWLLKREPANFSQFVKRIVAQSPDTDLA